MYLDKRGDLRLPTFHQVDLRVDKAITVFSRIRAVVSMDVFNLLNENMALSVRGGQNASNANQISSCWRRACCGSGAGSRSEDGGGR